MILKKDRPANWQLVCNRKEIPRNRPEQRTFLASRPGAARLATTKKLVRLALGFALAVLFLWLILRQIELTEVSRAFTGADSIWIIAALSAFSAGYTCRIERWRVMLQRDNPDLKWTGCAGPLLASFAINNVLPFRSGDVLRSFAFTRSLGVTSGVVVATLFVERLLDFLMLLIALGMALMLAGTSTAALTGAGGSALMAVAIAASLLLLFPSFFAPLLLTAGRMISRLSPAVGSKVSDEINKGLTTLQHLASYRTMFKLISWSVAAWFAEGCLFWFAALALPSITVPRASWLALPVGTLATLIPSTPGYVGTFDYFTIRAMAELGNSATAATAYALLVHLLLWLPPTLIGGLYLVFHYLRSSERRQLLQS